MATFFRQGAMVLLACASGASYAGESEVRAAVQRIVPQATIDELRPAASPGYFEVVAQGQVFYVSDDGQHLLVGDLWSSNGPTNLTEARKRVVRSKALDSVAQERRIVFPATSPKHTVTVFTDFDCSYCQQFHRDVGKYNELGISVEYLLYPRGGPRSSSFDKAVSVWCAADRKSAFTLAKSGKDPEPASCPNPVSENFALVQSIGGVIGTPAVIDSTGAMTGYQPPEKMLAWLETKR